MKSSSFTTTESYTGGGHYAVAAKLSLAYVSFVMPRMFIAVISPSLQFDDDKLEYTVSEHTFALVLCGVTYGACKLITGPITDRVNPLKSFIFFLGISAIATFALSYVHEFVSYVEYTVYFLSGYEIQINRYHYLLFWAMVNAAAQSGGWPSVSRCVYYTVPPEVYPQVISALSIASRVGAVLVSCLVGICLTHLDWQGATRVVAFLTMMGILPLLSLNGSIPYQNLSLSKVSMGSFSVTWSEARTHGFVRNLCINLFLLFKRGISALKSISFQFLWWRDPLFAVSVSSFSMLGLLASFELFIPLFLCSTLSITTARAAYLSAILPAGFVVSILLGNLLLTFCQNGRLDSGSIRKYAVIVMLLLLFLVNICLVFWTLGVTSVEISNNIPDHFIPNVSKNESVLMMLLFSFGVLLGYPFYVPPSVFALEFEGGKHSGVVMSQIDFLTALISAIFAKYIVKSVDTWAFPLFVLTLCSLAAFLMQLWTLFYERGMPLKSSSKPPRRGNLLTQKSHSFSGKV